MHKDILKVKKTIYQQEQTLSALIKKHYPPGSEVSFTKGRGEIDAEIIMSGGEGMKIRNLKTGKEYWIMLYDLMTDEEWHDKYN